MVASHNAVALLRQNVLDRLAAQNDRLISRSLCTELVDWIIYGGIRPFGFVPIPDRRELHFAFNEAQSAVVRDSGMPGMLDSDIAQRLEAVVAMPQS